MKKYLCIFMLFCMVFPLAGCRVNDQAPTQEVCFYYKASQLSYGDGQSLFQTELRSVNADPTALTDVIRLYLLGPKNEGLANSFPSGTTLIDLQVDTANATVILGGSYTSLSGYEKTIACACLTMTLCPLANVPQITVLAENDPPESEKGIVMRPEDLILLDTSKIPIEENQ